MAAQPFAERLLRVAPPRFVVMERMDRARADLLRASEASAVLLLTVHHIAADGESMGPLVSDMMAAYAARATGAGHGRSGDAPGQSAGGRHIPMAGTVPRQAMGPRERKPNRS